MRGFLLRAWVEFGFLLSWGLGTLLKIFEVLGCFLGLGAQGGDVYKKPGAGFRV